MRPKLHPEGTYRAEATDVANAVLDGIDCILLGAETLRGLHPVSTVRTILSICQQAEKVFDHVYHFEHLMQASFLLACCLWSFASVPAGA